MSELKIAMMFNQVYEGLCAGKSYTRRAWVEIDNITRGYDTELDVWYFLMTKIDGRKSRTNNLYADDIFATDWEEVY